MFDQAQTPGARHAAAPHPTAFARAGSGFRRFVARPNFMLSVGAGIVLTVLGGPFGTLEDLPLPQRSLYWSLAIGLPALLLTYLSFLARALNQPPRLSTFGLGVVVGLIGAVPSWGLVVVLDRILPFAQPYPALALLPMVLVPVVVVTVLINLLFDATRGTVARGDAQTARPPAPFPAPDARAQPGDDAPPGGDVPDAGPAGPAPQQTLLARLPPRIGRDVISLQAQGHYLEVTTTRGRALVLMQISRAEADLADFPGLRVHRSWWVNLAHVRQLSVRAGRARLSLSNGGTVPVARALRRSVTDRLARLPERRDAPPG